MKVFRRNSAARVREPHDHVRFVHIGADPQNSAAFHRFETVFDDVVERLLHLAAIKLEQWQIGAQFRLHHDVARFDLGREKAHRFLYDGVNIFGLKLRTRRPDRAQELGNDGIESIDFASTNLDRMLQFVAFFAFYLARLPFHQLQVNVQ